MLIIMVKDEAAFASSVRAIRRMPDAFWQIAAELMGAADAVSPANTHKVKAALEQMDVFRHDTAFEEYRPD
jgi:NAD-dependent SIR2 family protein deacetylase